MTDSKYSDLPGIAYDQVDVYETTDLPESEQFEIYSEDKSDPVERLHLNATDAFNKFKNKTVTSETIDFSDSISRKPKTGYRFQDYEFPGEGETETPIQKYQRLQCEIKELYEEINEIKEKTKDEEEAKSTTDLIAQVEQIDKELNTLKLQESLGPDFVELFSDPQGTRLKQLTSQIELFQQSGAITLDTDSESKELKLSKAAESGTLEYRMMYLPEKARILEVARLVQLERRICCLENAIGTTTDKFTTFSQNLKCQGILDAVQQLGAKAALLETKQLDTIENRLAALIHTMDTITQKKSTMSPDSEVEQKVSEMYKIMKNTEAMSEILPQTVNRMLALKAIHRQAAEFSKSLKHLEELQTQINTRLDNNKILLKNVQENFTSNLNVIKNNIESFNERVQKLNK